MKTPRGLEPLIEEGVIDAVLRPLKSGKEATVYLVESSGRLRCAKVYKDATQRGFQRMAEYQENRRVRGSRDQRAMGRRSRHGRAQQEQAWKNAEVEALYRLAAAGVRVPEPLGYFSGVLLMEMIQDASGQPAPRLNEIIPSPEQASRWHAFLIDQIVRMLCAGLIHGDLSEFNVLVDPGGPVIIDLPQAVEASAHNNAFRLLARDVENITAYAARAVPALRDTFYAHEIWGLYQRAELRPGQALTGRYVPDPALPDVDGVLEEIAAARREAEARQRGREAAAADFDD
ncbi:MAG TPA: PA4780 family RIO1-like protein kinase [Nevskiaceae bacterium]|nr:PA4780 family RIO1-like protein kinase [Nevskiaceae bacterium]